MKIDLSRTVKNKSNQLNSDDFLGLENHELIIKIRDVVDSGSEDQPTHIFYEGDNNKPYKPNLTFRKILLALWGEDGSYYIGQSMRLYVNKDITWGKEKVGGIEISAITGIEKDSTVIVVGSLGRKKAYPIKKLVLKIDNNQALKDAGLIAAQKGMEAFTVWGKSLSVEQKTSLTDYIKELMVIAKNFDAKGN